MDYIRGLRRDGPTRLLRTARDQLPDILRDFFVPAAIDALDIALTRKDLAARCRADDRLWELDVNAPSESFRQPAEVSDSVTCSGDRAGLFAPDLSHGPPISTDPGFVCEVPDARVVGLEPVAATADGQLIIDTVNNSRVNNTRLVDAVGTVLWRQGVRWGRDAFLQGHSSAEDTVKFNTACLLTNPWTNYYHFTVEHLPKLRAVEHYRERTGRDPTLIVPPDPPSWIWELLTLAGASLDNCVPWDGTYGEVDRLVVPSHPSRYPTPATCRWLRDRVCEDIPDRQTDSDPGRVFISRRKATERDVLNEEAVIDVLAEYGFQRYVLEDIPVAEQAALFDAADAVVAPHGAGLTNIIYARDISIVELLPLTPSYMTIADHLNHEYRCLNCKWDGSDIRVDIKELRRVVRRAI